MADGQEVFKLYKKVDWYMKKSYLRKISTTRPINNRNLGFIAKKKIKTRFSVEHPKLDKILNEKTQKPTSRVLMLDVNLTLTNISTYV